MTKQQSDKESDSSAKGEISAAVNYVKGNASSPDLRNLLESLGEKIARTAELMEADEATLLAQRYRMFADEAVSKKPDKTILSSIGAKIMEITSPVIKFATDIAKMIGAIKDLV